MGTKRAIRRAYELMGTVTPLISDCGLLCKGACCKGDENTGMWVFPGEEVFLENFMLRENETNTVAICGGTCNRDERPLSCRIFPLFPMVIEHPRTGRLTVEAMPDPRAFRICPLFREGNEITPEFKKTVERVGKELLKDRTLRSFLLETTDFLRYLYTVKEKLG